MERILNATLADAEIGQIAITVADLDKALAFYRDRLGLKLLFEAGGMAFFDLGGVRLMLGPGDPSHCPGDVIVYLKVRGIEAMAQSLTATGVTLREAPRKVHDAGGTALWLAFFEDLDSHVLALMEERASP